MKRLAISVFLFTLLTLPAALAFGQRDDTIVIRSIGNLTTLNPMLSSDGGSFMAQQLLFPLLFEIDPFTALPQPGLTTWEVSEDGLTYTFTIRDDAFWSDGTPITSADAKFTYDGILSDQVESVHKGALASVQAVNIMDDKTFEIVLSGVNCAIFSDLGRMHWVPAHRFAPDFSDVMTNPLNSEPTISGGPYILTELRADEFQRFEANPSYWGGTPNIPNVIIRIIEEPSIVNQALLAGEIDYSTMSADQFEQLGSLENFNVVPLAEYFVGTMHLNWVDRTDPQPAYDADGNLIEQTPHPIFADVRVRQAFAMGYDKHAILESMGGSQAGTVISSLIVPALEWAYDPSVEPWPYDPQRAAALLDEAGWIDQDGDGIRECHGCLYAEEGTPLAFEISYSPLFTFFETTALVAQDQLGQLGMDITVTEWEWSSYLADVLIAQDFDATTLFWGAFSPPDPSGLDFMLKSIDDIPGSGWNVQSYINPELDALMDQARTIPGCSTEERAAIYSQLQRIQHEDVAIDFTISHYTFNVMNKRVRNFNPGPWRNIAKYVKDLSLGE